MQINHGRKYRRRDKSSGGKTQVDNVIMKNALSLFRYFANNEEIRVFTMVTKQRFENNAFHIKTSQQKQLQ